jgi:hypothetical protein
MNARLPKVISPAPIAAAPGLLQRKARKSELGSRTDSSVPPIVDEVLRSPGRPLDAEMRVFMEPRFGHDFSQVRVHTDAKAGESARAVNAAAYTVGRDVVFGAERYAPSTESGQRLLAHELAHVVQQHGDATAAALTSSISEPVDPLEKEAERVSERLASGEEVAVEKGIALSGRLYRVSVGALPLVDVLPLIQQGGGTAPVRAADVAVAQTGSAAPGADECAGWFADPESMSKRAAEHYVRTELTGNRGVVEKIACSPNPGDPTKYTCDVHFSDKTTTIEVDVRWDKIAVYQNTLPRLECWYDYRCPPPNRDLVLIKRECRMSSGIIPISPY